MGATILEGAIVENAAFVAAGAVVPPGRVIPKMELWGGSPAKFIRKIGKIEYYKRQALALKYFKISELHKMEFTTYGTSFMEADRIVERVERVLPYEEPTPPEYWDVWKNMTDHTPFKEQIDPHTIFEKKKIVYDKNDDMKLI